MFSKFINYLLGSLESLSHNAHPIFGSRKNQSYYYRLQATASIPSDFWSYFVQDLPLTFSARSFIARSFAERKTPPSNHPRSISVASHLISEFWSYYYHGRCLLISYEFIKDILFSKRKPRLDQVFLIVQTALLLSATSKLHQFLRIFGHIW